jgi:hypothetical protein
MVTDKVDDIRVRLEGIAEELADLSMEALREAVEQGATKRPPEERTYTQARRAVEKAARLLAD